ncbi:cupin domain-containing protein [Chloroflexota bacterium]
MRRVVTGHTKSGKSVFVSDGEPTRTVMVKDYPGPELIEVWATDGIPTIPVDEGDPTIEMSSFVPGPGGTRFRIIQMPPKQKLEHARGEGKDVAAGWQEFLTKIPGLGDAMEPEYPGMHTTDTVDYGIILSGEIWLELDDGVRVHLKPGDCIIQNGPRHRWRNLGSEPCTMAFVMVGAKRKK